MRIQTIGSRTLLAFAAGTAVLASLPLAGPAYAWNVSTSLDPSRRAELINDRR